MHQTLKIDEILRVILQYLQQVDHYHLACVCKGFLEPALDALWHTLKHGSDPLYRLLPDTEVFHCDTPYDGIVDMVVLTRQLVGGEWDRFFHHSKRVRDFTLGGFCEVPFKHVQYLKDSLKQHGLPPFLLPNLHSLTYEMHVEDDWSYEHASLFLSTSLRAISVPNYDHDLHDCLGAPFFDALAKLRPSITSLSLGISSSYYGKGGRQVFKTFPDSLRLVDLSGGAEWEVVQALGPLPILQSMSLGSFYQRKDLEAVPSSWFPSLRVLRADARLALHILSSAASRTLMTEIVVEHCLIGPNRWENQDTLGSLIEVLGSFCPNVVRFILQHFDLRYNPLPPHPTTPSFMPLEGCANIVHFEFHSKGRLKSPTDEEYAVLVAAWPQLREIKVETSRPPRATVASLELLSSHPNAPLDLVDIEIYDPSVEYDTGSEEEDTGSEEDEIGSEEDDTTGSAVEQKL